jgi:hypothetical protein
MKSVLISANLLKAASAIQKVSENATSEEISDK